MYKNRSELEIKRKNFLNEKNSIKKLFFRLEFDNILNKINQIATIFMSIIGL